MSEPDPKLLGKFFITESPPLQLPATIPWKAYARMGRPRVYPGLLERLKPGAKNPILVQDTVKELP